jgi:hypothetical protein
MIADDGRDGVGRNITQSNPEKKTALGNEN